MHKRYQEILNRKINDKVRSIDTFDQWMGDVDDGLEFDEKIKITVASILDVYGEDNIINASRVMMILLRSPTSHLLQICKDTGIIVGSKLMKRSDIKEALARKILSRYIKPRVRNLLNKISHEVVFRYYGILLDKNIPCEDRLQKFLELNSGSYDDPGDDVEASKAIECASKLEALIFAWGYDDELIQYIFETFTDDVWNMYEHTVVYIFYAIYMAGSRQNTLQGMNEEIKRLKKKYNEQLKAHKQLNEQLEKTQEEQEKLLGQIQQLDKNAEKQLEEALLRISELENLLSQKDEKIDELQNEILNLQQQIAGRREKPLEGYTICVVGPPHYKQFYIDVIEKYGGKCEFHSAVFDAESPRLVRGPVSRSDIVLYITSYTSHAMRDYLRPIAGDKLRYIESEGRTSFERILLTRIIPQLQPVNSV